jgi:hypothetical protein
MDSLTLQLYCICDVQVECVDITSLACEAAVSPAAVLWLTMPNDDNPPPPRTG